MRSNQLTRSVIAAFVAFLLVGAPALFATNSLPPLWPTFSRPTTIVNVQLSGNGQSGDDLLAETTFAGAYNQKQLNTRLYLSTISDGPYWLAHAVPSGIAITQIANYTTTDRDGALKAMLQDYGPQGSSTVTKYVVCDPVSEPESCNMATTLAGINDAMVVNPDNVALVSSYGLTLVADLTTYQWIANNTALVNSTTTNMIANPSGASATTGWNNSGGSAVTTGTAPCGGTTLKWTRTSGTGDAWAFYDPANMRLNSTPYIFSVQVCGIGQVFLDAYNGAGDVQTTAVTLSSSWQTLQLAVPIPLSGATGNSSIKLQVRTSQSSVTVYFRNAAVIDNRVAIDTWQYNNQLKSNLCRESILVQDNAGNYNLRDYAIAANMFTFDLSQDNADEKALYQSILTYGGNVGTPVLGYVDDENNDVPFLSGQGLWLNASDDYNNGSVWASFPQPSGFRQPAPAAVNPVAGTVYVALTGSDGDNWSIIEHQMFQHWTHGQYLGAVPMGWTMSPALINAAPGIISNFYQFLPQADEIMSATTGIGYTQNMSSTAMGEQATYTRRFMTAEDMSSVMTWDPAGATGQNNTETFAQDLDASVAHLLWVNPISYTTYGTIPTVLDGQEVNYNPNPQAEANAIMGISYSATEPNFIEALNDDLTTSQDDVLYIAQYLQNNGGHPYVFLTPSELALTEKAYHSGTTGLPATNTQAVAGSTLTAAYPNNRIYNADGEEPGASITSKSWALGSSGHDESLLSGQKYGTTGGLMELHVPGGAGVDCYAYEKLSSRKTPPVVGRYYRFSASVAGTGTAFMTIYDGTANNNSASVTLSSTFQTITMVIDMKSATTGQIQIALAPSSSAQTLYFSAATSAPPGWFYTAPSTNGAGIVSFGGTTYNNGYFNAQALSLGVPAGQTGPQWMNFLPTSLTTGAVYNVSVDVAGKGQAYVNFWDGDANHTSSTVTLSTQWQTITTSGTVATTGTPQFQIGAPASNSGQTVYYRNASLIKSGSGGVADFHTGLETGDPHLNWTNTVDSTSPGGGESNVSSSLTASSSTITRAGSNAIQYGGTASGGSATHAYLEAFSNSTTLSSTSRLSYWIYPITPMGSESGASSTIGLNSTCVAIDIIFTDGTALRNLAVRDQYGNTLAPASECNHLQPDQWNYVTANLSSISGKTVSRIDVGYDQPGAGGNYGGYVDDITLSH
jgi:hypothetical protein